MQKGNRALMNDIMQKIEQKTRVFRALKSMPVQLVISILIVVLCGSYFPHPVARAAYTFSLLMKDLLLFVLPLAVASFIASTLISFRQNALLLVLVLLIFEGISNAISVMYAYGVGVLCQQWIPVFQANLSQDFQLVPFFQMSDYRPGFWSSVNGVCMGTLLGVLGATVRVAHLDTIVFRMRDYMGLVFSRVFVRLIPLYVFGFLVFMQHSGLLEEIVNSYVSIIAFVTFVIFAYLTIILLIASRFKGNELQRIIRHIWPTGVISFTTMSSAATMPFTIEAAEKNLKTPGFAAMLIPATTNIQQVGDCIANAFLCLVILKNFGKPMPDLMSWSIFLMWFTLARYTTAAVLGGAIFIMVPIYEHYLGFTYEMTALIIALNVVLDPIITSTNVLCNGALAIVFERLWLWIKRYHPVKTMPFSARQ